MKEKQQLIRSATFTALLFVLLGYTVKFYPEQLAGIDSAIQTAFRGDLPAAASRFWTSITVLGNTAVILSLALACMAFCYWKKWKAECYFILIGMASMGVLSTAFKYLYQRPRPQIEWLIDTVGYSFPSWHTASTLMLAGMVLIILQQRMAKGFLLRLIQGFLVLLAVLVALSRIYIGVHYPTDILGGWLLALVLLQGLYPFYDGIRFRWRFQSKQP